jgi:hypothetical protein
MQRPGSRQPHGRGGAGWCLSAAADGRLGSHNCLMRLVTDFVSIIAAIRPIVAPVRDLSIRVGEIRFRSAGPGGMVPANFRTADFRTGAIDNRPRPDDRTLDVNRQTDTVRFCGRLATGASEIRLGKPLAVPSLRGAFLCTSPGVDGMRRFSRCFRCHWRWSAGARQTPLWADRSSAACWLVW